MLRDRGAPRLYDAARGLKIKNDAPVYALNGQYARWQEMWIWLW